MSRALHYRSGAASAFVERIQARGRFGFTFDTVLAETGLSPAAAAAQLRRLAPGVVALYPRAGYYLIVPPEHRAIGAPPLTWWIDDFFANHRQEPYYLGLLTAAARHGAQHQVPQIAQILTQRPHRPLKIGRLKILFVTKKAVAHTPTIRVTGGWAPFRMSTPDATVLDLLRYPEHVGGIDRVAELITELRPKLTMAGFRRALAAPHETTVSQRAGFLLETLKLVRENHLVAVALEGRRLQPITLEIGGPLATTPNKRWNVRGYLSQPINP